MMPTRHIFSTLRKSCLAGEIASCLAAMIAPAYGVSLTKADNATALGTASSWVENTVPGVADTLLWDATVTTANTVSATNGSVVGGLKITNPGGAVSISVTSNGQWTFNNNAMIDMSSAGGANLTLSGGTLGIATANLSPAITVASGRTLTFQGVNSGVSNQGGLNKTLTLSGGGTINFNSTTHPNFVGSALTVLISGANVTIAGASSASATHMSSGSLLLGAATSLGGGPSVLSGGTLGFCNTGVTIANPLQIVNTVTIGQSANLAGTFSGTLTGNGTLQNANTGTTISNDISFTGNLSEFYGTIHYTDSSTHTTNSWRVGASNATADLSRVTLQVNAGTGSVQNFGFSNGISGATLKVGELKGDGVIQGAFAVTAPATANTLEVGAKATNTEFSGVIGVASAWMDAIALTKVGSGNLTLTGTNLYNGGTTIKTGTLQVGNGGTSGDLGSGAVTNNAELLFKRSDTFVVANAIGGTGSVTMNDIGTLALSSANTFSGALYIYAGAVRLDHADAAQNASKVAVNVNNGLTFGTGITAATIRALTGTGSFALTSTDGQGVTLSVGITSTSSTYSGVLSGAGSLAKMDLGTIVLAVGGQSYAGTTSVSGGTLQTSASGDTASNILGAGALNLSNRGAVRFNSASPTTFNSGLDIGSGGGMLYFDSSSTFSPATTTGSGPLTLQIGDSATLTPTTFNGWSGELVVISPGAATVSLASNFDNSSLANAYVSLADGISVTRNAGTNAALVTDIGTLTGQAGSSLGGSLAGTGTYTFSVGSRNENSSFAGSLVDGGTKTALTKMGSGTLTLAGTNTYTGATTITAGTLQINGSLASAAVAVNGGKLDGSGTMRGSVTVNSGGMLSPGNGPGLLGVGSLVLSSGSVTLIEVNATMTRGMDFDGIDVTTDNGLIYGGDLQLAFANSAPLASSAIALFNFSGSATGSLDRVTSTGFYAGTWTNSAGTWSLSSDGQILSFSQLTGYLTVVPEPSTWLLLEAGLGILVVTRRRRSHMQPCTTPPPASRWRMRCAGCSRRCPHPDRGISPAK